MSEPNDDVVLDVEVEARVPAPERSPAPPAPPTAATPAEPRRPGSPVLARLLRMADGYLRAGAPHQAIEIYLELVDGNGATPEGEAARDRLLEICDGYERAGKMHQARALYERLL